MPTIENHKEMVPFEHYVGLYAKLDPAEAAARCDVPYDPVTQSFKMRLFYVDYELTWPAFSIRSRPSASYWPFRNFFSIFLGMIAGISL